MQEKIFISAPQHSSKMYAFDRWLTNVNNFTYKNIEVFLADNSENEDNSIFINSKGVKCSWVQNDKTDSVFKRICDSHNVCRAEFLKSGCDYWLHLETDVICPINTIEMLLAHDKPIVSAVYDIGLGEDRRLMAQTIDEHHKDIKAFRTTQFIEQDDEAMFFDGTCKKIFQCGLGCVLISKEVAKLLKFRYVEGVNASADTFFYNDLWQKNIDVYIDTNVMCEHYNENWALLPETN